MQKEIEKIRESFAKDLAAVQDSVKVEELRIKYLGRKEGLVTKLFEEFAGFDVDKKREFGSALNGLKKEIEESLQSKAEGFSDLQKKYDFNVPAKTVRAGHLHPITQIQKQLEEIFLGLGFDIKFGPEIESDYYNFESLNIPEDHPARDMQDTFYLDKELPKGEKGKNLVLRTHISNMQVRYMETHKAPYAVILPGRVYRNESLDASHEHTYQYIEGLVVGPDVNFAKMSWTLDYAMKELFGEEVRTKLLPSYFPFVEPGAEMAISCLVCKGAGCSVCKQTGWVEILGCGMVHQKVFEAAGYKPNEVQGFAFGFGLSRMALMKYQIPDIRYFAENDLRFLEQF